MTLPVSTQASTQSAAHSSRSLGSGYLFGVPLGDLGWFATLLMSLTSGFVAFFAATFAGIVWVLISTSFLHRPIDYSISYRLIGLPVGLLVLAVVGLYLGMLWVRRIFRKA